MPRTFGEGSGNERSSTLRTTSAKRVASRSVLVAAQCVYQSASRTRSELRERRGEHEKERDHVRQHGVGAGPAPELRHQSAREADAAAEPRARAELANAHVGGQPGGAPTDAQRTTSSSERAASASHEVERLRQRRVLGVERLGDEDEPHQTIVRSTSFR